MIFAACLGLISCGGSGGPSPHTSIGNPLKILSGSTAVATIGRQSAIVLAASGGTQPYWWTVTKGRLPVGLALDSSTGKIAGTPTQTGDFSFTVVVKDSAFIQQQSASKILNMTVSTSQLVILTPAMPAGVPGRTYSLQMLASGGVPPYTWSIASGALAPGLELNPLTGVISGTPTTEGTFSVTIQVADSNYPPSYATFRMGAPEGESPRGISSQNQLYWGTAPGGNLSAARTRLFLTDPYIAR